MHRQHWLSRLNKRSHLYRLPVVQFSRFHLQKDSTFWNNSAFGIFCPGLISKAHSHQAFSRFWAFPIRRVFTIKFWLPTSRTNHWPIVLKQILSLMNKARTCSRIKTPNTKHNNMLFWNIVMISPQCNWYYWQSLIIDNHIPTSCSGKSGKESNIRPNACRLVVSRLVYIFSVVLTLSDIPIHLPF